jgi:hypothetical protein
MERIDKKACRRFLEPVTPPSSDCGLFLVESLKYIVRTAVKIVGHRRLLILCLYARGETPGGRPKLAFTMFQASDSFITYDHDPDSKTRWRTAMLDNLDKEYGFSFRKCAFYSRPDEQRVLNFCKGRSEEGFNALGWMQVNIREKECRLRVRRRQQKVVREFQPLRPLPGDLGTWLGREILPAYFYYDAKKGAKKVRGVCSACGQESELEGVRHNAKGVCPRCGREFTMKSNRKHGFLCDRETASVVQRLRDGELVVRIIKVYRSHRRGESAFLDFYEETRVIVRQAKDGKFKAYPYHHSSYDMVLTPWKKGYPPVMFLYGPNFNAETCGYLYTRNLKRELNGTPWQYCQLEPFYQGVHDQMEVAPYLTAYRKYPAIEFFVKLKLFWLASQIAYRGNFHDGEDLLNLQGKNLREVLQIEPSDLPWLQQSKHGIRDLLLLRILRREGYQPSEELFSWLDIHSVSETGCLELALKYTTPHKLVRYLDRQFIEHSPNSYRGTSGTLSDYKDYLRFCEELHYDLRNEFVLFPKHLARAHDVAQSRIKQKDVEQYDARIAGIREGLKRQYQFKSKGLVVLPPRSAQEIVIEGQKLHHCVGGYAENMANDRCTILFIRREKRKSKPFYTVEVRGDRVIQVRGANNCAPTPEVHDFLEVWEKKKHLKGAA